MHQRPCRLTIADKFYGGGPEIPQRDPGSEFGTFKQFAKGNIGMFNKFFASQPLLSGAKGAALGGLTDLPYLIDPLKAKYGSMANTGYLDDIIASQGKLTPELQRQAEQEALTSSSAAGMAHTNTGIFSQLLNSAKYSADRLAQAFQERGQDISQRLGLAGGIQGLRSGAIQPALATETAATGAYSALTNPIWNYLSDLFGGNQSAAADQAIAGGNKQSGALSGAVSLIGAAATAY